MFSVFIHRFTNQALSLWGDIRKEQLTARIKLLHFRSTSDSDKRKDRPPSTPKAGPLTGQMLESNVTAELSGKSGLSIRQKLREQRCAVMTTTTTTSAESTAKLKSSGSGAEIESKKASAEKSAVVVSPERVG